MSLKSKSVSQLSISSLAVGASINTAPCALSLQLDTSLYSITQIIREARTLAINGRQVWHQAHIHNQGFGFYLTCQITLFFMVILSYCLLLPPIFEGYQMIFTLWFLFPWISFSFFFSPYDPQVMTHMPGMIEHHSYGQ